MIKVIIADDHQIMIDGIKAMLESDAALEIVGTATNGVEVLELLKNQSADVLLLDFHMPVMDGLETTLHVKKLYPDLQILMLTTNDEGSIITSIFKRGATGYLLKNSSKDALIRGIKDAAVGKKVLSPHLTSIMIDSLSKKTPAKKKGVPIITKRELEVLQLLAKGHSTQQIADELYVSTNTVATHKRNLFVKMDVKNSVGMIKKAVDWGML